jgi:ABC-2 type transport system permease protein
MRALYIALKDLSQVFRDWKSDLYLLLMPLAFTFFFGLMAYGTGSDPRGKVGWVDNDAGGEIGVALQGLLAASQEVLLEEQAAADIAAVESRVRDGTLAAAVIVPSGFSAAVSNGSPKQLSVIADSASSAGRAAVEAIRAEAARVLLSAEAARFSLEAAQAILPAAALPKDEPARAAWLRDGIRRAMDAWSRPRVDVKVQTAGALRSATGFTQASPGMMVQFAIFGLVASAMVLVTERRTRVMQRLLTTPVSVIALIGGHLLAMFLVVFLQEAVLVACGQFLFGVRYLSAPLGTFLMMASLAAWVASLGLLISALARKEQQVVVFSLAAMFVFSALGGAWFPLDATSGGFAAVGRIFPAAWAMTGFQNIVLRGLGADSTLLPAGILIAWTAAFFAIAVLRFRYE